MSKTIRKYSTDEYNEQRKNFYREYAKGPRPIGAYRLPDEEWDTYDSKGPSRRKVYPMYGKK